MCQNALMAQLPALLPQPSQNHLILRLGDGDPARSRKLMLALYAFLADKPENTRRSYRTGIKLFFDMVGWKPPEKVTVADAVAFKRQLVAQQKAPATICARLAAVDSFFDFLTKPTDASGETLLVANPFSIVSRKDVSPTPYSRSTPVASGDAGKMIGETSDSPLGHRDRAVLIFLAYTGRRRSEVANLRARDLDLRSRPRTYTVRVKGGREQKFELPEVCFQAIKAHWHSAGRQGKIKPTSGVFTSMNTLGASPLTAGMDPERPISHGQVAAIVKSAARRAGLDWTKIKVHGFRHMVARDLDATGARLQDIQRFLGHLQPNTTSIYLGQLRAPVPSMEKALDAVRAKAKAAAEAA